jgi:ABC-type Fe3+ transport system permease subunit
MNRFYFWQTWLFVVGLVVVVFGLALAFFIARYPFRNRERWAWNCLAVGLLL